MAPGRRLASPPPRPLVTVAAEHGAGGNLVAPRVADALGVPFLDRALPASLAAAQERSQPVALVGRLARASSVLAGESVERLDAEQGRIRAELAEFLARAATTGGVILGRGGAVVLGASPTALHVLLAGEHEGRVARVAAREGIPRDEAARRVREHDQVRKEYLRSFFDADADDRGLYHLIVNTVALGINASVELIVRASRVRVGQPPAPRES